MPSNKPFQMYPNAGGNDVYCAYEPSGITQFESSLTMRTRSKFWPVSSIILAVAGILVAGIGIFFIFRRPPLLVEDIRYMRLSAAELAAIGPRLGPWLANVFRVLGGYVLATGLLTMALAATSFRERRPVAVAVAFISGAASIGLMATVNFVIDSDFKWVLFGVAVVWLMSAVAFGAEAWLARSAAPAETSRETFH